MSWIKDVLTEVNGESFDIKRVTAATMVIGFHANETYSVFFQHIPFDLQQYAIAASAMLAAIGASIALGVKGEAPITP
jgi:hypothetical protein